MSGEEQTLGAARQTFPGDAADGRPEGGPEERLVRLRRVALPADQRNGGKRQARGGAGLFVPILAGAAAYCLPVVALGVALGALGYSAWVVADVARSAGSLDLSRVADAFGQVDAAARALMASITYALLVLTLSLLAAALRRSESWLPLLAPLIVVAPVVLLFTLGADLAFSLAPAGVFPPWGRDAIEGLVLGHAIFLAVLLRVRRPVTQALDNLTFTRRRDVGTLYTGALPRLHVIRFGAGAAPTANEPPHLFDSPAAAPLAAPAVESGDAVTATLEGGEPQSMSEPSVAASDATTQDGPDPREGPATR